MASKFTIRPTPHLPINEMRIHLSLFVQEPGSKNAHYRILTLEKRSKTQLSEEYVPASFS